MSTTAPDLSKTPPRSGRDLLGGYAFLARSADKVRAEQAGTADDYIGFCPMTMAFLDACGVSREQFGQLIAEGADDSQLVAYFDRHVPPERKAAANDRILNQMAANLDRQDAEEGRK
ncbi:MAG TPA: DUF5069 domain-containing protein [Oscillatoriaceae cyanobacterium]